MNDLALVFPGQGSQKINMLAPLADRFPDVISTFAEASAVLGYDLWKLVQEGPSEKLNLTEYTQPMLLTASVAIWRIWRQQGGPQPGFMAGHSLGEWSALVCSEAVAFVDAVKLVQQRGKFMQEAVPEGEGSMAVVIGLDNTTVNDACREAMQGKIVTSVNFNAPGQVVIAGDADAISRAIVNCKKCGAKRVLSLPVSGPFHTQLMRPAAKKLLQQVKSVCFRPPRIPVVHNVNARVAASPDRIRRLMITQIYRPVLWVDCVNTLVNAGVKRIIECGPGKVLTGLINRIDSSLMTAATEYPDDLHNALNS